MKVLRLKKNREFQKVFKKGAYAADSLLVLYVLKNAGQKNFYGVSVGKKVGKSVTRNRVKRRIRECIKKYAHAFKPGYDVIVLARAQACTASLAKLERSFERLIKKAACL